MILNEVKYGYNDLTIVPNVFSKIESRKEIVTTYDSDKYYPIFTAPMASVVNESNYDVYENNKIHAIIPRNISYEKRFKLLKSGKFVALSLNEFELLFCDEDNTTFKNSKKEIRVCIDIANGHMTKIYKLCTYAKKLSISNKFKLTIMTGNIANPETYRAIARMKIFNEMLNEYVPVIDYIRCSIGSGCGCITSSNTGVHYPIASLIDECYNIKMDEIADPERTIYDKEITKIVADGGIRNYDDIIKALALGADYVMIGSLFSKCVESAGEKFMKNGDKLTEFNPLRYTDLRYEDETWYGKISEEYIKNANILSGGGYSELKNDELKLGEIYVKYFGMASKDGQKSINGKKRTTAEGITKNLKVEYLLSKWVENFDTYLRSAMSYCNILNMESFIGTPKLVVNSNHETLSVNK